MGVRSRQQERSVRAEPCRVISAAAPLCSQTSKGLCTDRKCCGKCLRGRRNLKNEIVWVHFLCVRKRPQLELCQSAVCRTHRALSSHCEQVHMHFVKCFFFFTLLRNKLLVSFGEVSEYDISLKCSVFDRFTRCQKTKALFTDSHRSCYLPHCIVIPAWKSQS